MKFICLLIALFLISFLSVKSQEYVVTASGCSNTTTMTTVFSAVVDSNWLDHRELDFFLNIENRQFSGSGQNLKVILWVQGIPDTLVNQTVSNNTNIGRHFVTGRIYREDTLVYVGRGTLGFNGAPTSTDDFAGGSGNGAIITGVDFNSPISIQLTITWGVASANVYYNVISGRLTQL